VRAGPVPIPWDYLRSFLFPGKGDAMYQNHNGQVVISVGRKETCMFAWMRTDRQRLLDCVNAFREYVAGDDPLPFWRTGKTGEDILITDLDADQGKWENG
jgi:hypothetical protein